MIHVSVRVLGIEVMMMSLLLQQPTMTHHFGVMMMMIVWGQKQELWFVSVMVVVLLGRTAAD